MPLTSDLTLNVGKFDPTSISEQTAKVNEFLISKMESDPKWFEVGAAKYREMRWKGETALPGPTLLPQALDITIPSRERGREIPCRLLYPSHRSSEADRKKCRGVVMHFHGGGWVLGSHKAHDDLLQFYADAGDLAVVSVNYRLAPEDPFPKGPQDCFDAGEYLVENSQEQYGGPLKFIGGESAGAHLTLLTTFHLLKTLPDFKLSGLLPHYGMYNLGKFPACQYFDKHLILNQELIKEFIDAFVPGMTLEQKQDPSVSPFFEDIENFRGKLPSAFFTIGTEDPLLDDSVLMATKWQMAGGHAILKVYSGAPHSFNRFSRDILKVAGEAMDDTETYIKERLGP